MDVHVVWGLSVTGLQDPIQFSSSVGYERVECDATDSLRSPSAHLTPQNLEANLQDTGILTVLCQTCSAYCPLLLSYLEGVGRGRIQHRSD